jgi:putative transposase
VRVAYDKTKAPFNWTATADSILEKLQRLCSQISVAVHEGLSLRGRAA